MPYNSLLIKPDGGLSMCCAQRQTFEFGHISTTPNLQKAWEENEKSLAVKNYDFDAVEFACGHCLRESKNSENRWVQVNTNNFYVKIPTDGKIRFLEFTTSNLCNQTCTTCSSYFSSKWKYLEEEAVELSLPLDKWKNGESFNSFGQEHYRLSDDDIEKIFTLLPDLHVIYVKGGEPFADDNNYRVLKELIRVNPNCIIQLSTNMSKLPEKYLTLLSGRDVRISCSIDGIDETYNYVRSTKFENTLENLKRWKDAKIKGRTVVSITASLHNMYNMNESLEFWDKRISDVDGAYVQRWVNAPYFLSPSYIMTQEQIDDYYKSYLKKFNGYRVRSDNLYTLKSKPIDDNWRETLIKRFHMYNRFMNYKRGINIYDIHPQLRDI